MPDLNTRIASVHAPQSFSDPARKFQITFGLSARTSHKNDIETAGAIGKHARRNFN